MTLAELIDFELALARDRECSREALEKRDRAIAAALPVAVGEGRDDAELFSFWLSRVSEGTSGTGARIAAALRGAALLLFGLGVALGVSVVSAWLVTRDGLPLNAVKFWLLLVGAQLVLVALACIAMLPPRLLKRAPGLRELGELLAAAAQALPKTLLFLLRHSPWAGETSAAGSRSELALFRPADAPYRRVLFWRFVALTQRFAVGFNLGAIAALWLIPFLDDPAFGWRSRLLDPATTASFVRGLAAPWASAYPPGTLSAAAVAATQYSSLDPSLADLRGSEGPWSTWWPFLLCSLAVYGLLPRLAILGFAEWRGRRALSRAPFDDVDCERLRARLERVVVETRADGAEQGGAAGVLPADAVDAIALRGRPCALVIPPDFDPGRDLGERIARDSGVEIVRESRPYDRSDLAKSAAALRVAAVDVVLLAMPAYEPPVGERLDALDVLRAGVGERQRIVVVLEQPGGVERRHVAVWRRAMAERGDRYLDVIANCADGVPA